ncbi:PfkB family carbohydrate kinase [Halorubrum sp. AD140]|uniref:carbohydrate kinase family protein n=1 Tax=Halorubrum sp. AD140 TaxID=3050073 RepID=UPI002ACD1495|nr:PfkB family carbohydrate kinase [Halorubrum sp. AD140]MDZ5809891.1 PfkB family carbohydrate kinase [Halorubrum sp. AD140]
MAEILVAGETLIDLLPGAGETLHDVDGFSHRPGGAPANVAVGLSRLGAAPAFWTRLGNDPFGDFLAETLVAEDVPATRFERVDGNTTLAVVSPPGVDGRRFRFYGSGDVTFGFDPGSIPTDALASVSWVHLGGVALTHPDGREAMRELAAAAGERGCTVSFDVNYREDLVPDGERDAVVDAVREIVADSDVVFASDEDVAATGISSHEGERLGRDLLELGPHTAVVTLGAAGAVVASSAAAPWGERTVRHGGFAVDAVDATGAGDAFTSGLVARLSADEVDLADAVAFANATAALSVRERGGMTALPTEAGVEAFLADRR